MLHLAHALGLSAIFGFLAFVSAENAAAETVQSQPDFEIAVRETSTSPYIILLTVVDDRSGQSRTGCTQAPFLLGAITMEKLGGFGKTNAENIVKLQQAREIALNNATHVFHFSQQAALDNLPFGYPEACKAIEHGQRARIADITGQTLIDGR